MLAIGELVWYYRQTESFRFLNSAGDGLRRQLRKIIKQLSGRLDIKGYKNKGTRQKSITNCKNKLWCLYRTEYYRAEEKKKKTGTICITMDKLLQNNSENKTSMATFT